MATTTPIRIYNDIVVSQANGDIEILCYPSDVFPQAFDLQGVTCGGDVLIFGHHDWRMHPDRARKPFILRLETSSYHINLLPPLPSQVQVDLYEGCARRDGACIVLPIVGHKENETEKAIAFDLERGTWSNPFPCQHPER